VIRIWCGNDATVDIEFSALMYMMKVFPCMCAWLEDIQGGGRSMIRDEQSLNESFYKNDYATFDVYRRFFTYLQLHAGCGITYLIHQKSIDDIPFLKYQSIPIRQSGLTDSEAVHGIRY